MRLRVERFAYGLSDHSKCQKCPVPDVLSGRAERNKYLLFHAFTERRYLVPDRQYRAKNKNRAKDDEDLGTGVKAGGRRKPAYIGGIVLEPKKGFYDMFILSMDFNSLYPSIIQEYNIWFTTVLLKKQIPKKNR